MTTLTLTPLTPGQLTLSSPYPLSALSWFNVRDYGASGDGTSDASTAVQAALDAARLAGGGTVFFPVGVYLTTADLVVGSNTVLLGASRGGSVIKRSSTTATVAVIKNYDRTFGGTDTDITLQGLTVWRAGEATTANTPYDNVIYMKGVTRPSVVNCRVRGGAKGVHLEGCLHPKVDTSWFSDFVDNGLALTWTGSAFVGYGTLSNLDFDTPTASGFSLGSSSMIVTAGGVAASNLVFKDCASNAIELGNSAAFVRLSDIVGKYSGSGSVNNSILAMNVTDLTINGVDLERGSVSINVNTPASQFNDRIYLENCHARTGTIAVKNVRDGHVIGCSGSGATGKGVNIASCQDFLVADTVAHDNTQSGFYVNTNGSGPANARVRLVDCRAYDNGTAGSAGDTYGFLVDGGDKVQLVGNRAYDSAGASGTQTHGLYVNGTTNLTDQGNDFAGNKTAPRIAFTSTYTYASLPPTGLIGDELSYVEFTSAVNITATTEATSQVVVTAAAVVYDGNPVWVEFSCPYVQTPNVASSEALTVVLWDDTAGVSLGKLALLQNGASALIYQPGNGRRKVTPAARVSRVYSIRAYVSNAAGGNVGAGAGAAGNYMPGFIRVVRA